MKMTDSDKLATAWLKTHENIWSHNELLRLSQEQPFEAWRVIEKIIAQTDDDETLKMIGVGLIEDVLSENGETIILEVERFAKEEPKLLVALTATWKSTTPDAVWARIEKLLSESNHAA
jgi:hypothetical protein